METMKKKQKTASQQGWVWEATLFVLAFFLAFGPVSAQEAPKTQTQKPRKAANNPVPEGVKVVRDLPYVTRTEGAKSEPLLLDVYVPEKPSEKPLPVVIWVHGGGWKNGSKERCQAAYLAGRGFAVVSINYRLLDEAQWPAQIDDCYDAVRWVRRQAEKYGFDPDHIGAFGSSAGGHLVALMGTRPDPRIHDDGISSSVQAVCDWFGPSELLTMPPNVVSEKRTLEQVRQSNGALLLGATVREVPDLAKDASALDQVSKNATPFLIMHGSEDPNVPLEQSEKLHTALKAAGVESDLVIVNGAGHGGPLFKSPEVLDRVEAFFAKKLGRK